MTETQKAIEQEGQSFLETNYKASVDGINDNVIRAQVSIIIKQSYIAGRSKSLEEKEKEIERLKGLIKEGFIALNQEWKKPLGQIDADWGKFKTENNL